MTNVRAIGMTRMASGSILGAGRHNGQRIGFGSRSDHAMTVQRCYLCDEDPEAQRLYGQYDLAKGENCPICYRPACAYHLTVVRWRWRDSGQVDSARVCQSCKRQYAHRQWDANNRDWIT